MSVRAKRTDARAEWRRRQSIAAAQRRALFSFVAVADGHVKQLALLNDMARRVLVMCSRRAGKTYAMAAILLATAVGNPRSNSVYLAITKGQAKRTIWTDTWIALCDAWGVECTHNRTELVTSFPNGSHVYFGGTDDLRHIITELGQKLTLAIVDECQDQSSAVLKSLAEKILPPALADMSGRLILSGTIPETPSGYFWKQWERAKEGKSSWSTHNWSMLDNPHMKDPAGELAAHLADTGLPEDDPGIQRDWKGLITFEATALAFRYDKHRNGFQPGSEERDPLGKWVTRIAPKEIIDKCEFFCVGGDQGKFDRMVVQVFGWSSKHREMYQVYEWASVRDHGGAFSAFGRPLDQIRQLFGECQHYFDFGGAKLTVDNFRTDFGVYVLDPAKKADRRGQVERLNTLMKAARFFCMIGSDLEGDFETTKWDKDLRAKGKFEWSSDNHPDAADAGRYASQGYFDGYEPPPPPVPEEARGFEDDGADKPPWYDADMAQLLPDGPSELY